MSFAYKYHTWLKECMTIINKKKKENKRRKILAALAIYELNKKTEKVYSDKRFWIEPIFQERHSHGFYSAIFQVMSLHESRFRNYFRMTATQFEELLLMVAPQISKQTVIRKSISAEERLSLTLRLLLTIIIILR